MPSYVFQEKLQVFCCSPSSNTGRHQAERGYPNPIKHDTKQNHQSTVGTFNRDIAAYVCISGVSWSSSGAKNNIFPTLPLKNNRQISSSREWVWSEGQEWTAAQTDWTALKWNIPPSSIHLWYESSTGSISLHYGKQTQACWSWADARIAPVFHFAYKDVEIWKDWLENKHGTVFFPSKRWKMIFKIRELKCNNC